VPFKEGDLVFYYNPRKYMGRSEKWARKYTGPFRVAKQLSPVTVLLQAQNSRKTFVTHVDKLKHCSGDDVKSEREGDKLEPELGSSLVLEASDSRPRRNQHPPRRLISEC